ncbi:nucleolar MIF4G domain-containing protein 1 homolog [Prorops nasuta]|uniref:nucleolar MIF4G domain-containing protein 1 homolog n=1 Tax=Prorops nasuta TaxID=863751 RepID=UPI0034CF8A4A
MGSIRKEVKAKNKKNPKPKQKTRKELRKEKRKQKKVNRAQFYKKKLESPGKYVLNPNLKNSISGKDQVGIKKPTQDAIIKPDEKTIKKEKKLAKQMEKNKKLHMKECIKEEDKVIKRLEKQLKLNKRKSKSTPKSFIEDGLDYVLDFCDTDNRKSIMETEMQLLDDNLEADFEDDVALVKGNNSNKHDLSEEGDKMKAMNYNLDTIEEIESNFDEEYSNFDEDDDDYIEDKTNKFNSKIDKKDDDNSMSDLYDEEADDDESIDEEESAKIISKDDSTWEDIYGRKRDKEGNIINDIKDKYIPPAARMKDLEKTTTKTEVVLRLKRQMKGLLNRLAEHNMHYIASQVEELYMCNSRNTMNEILSDLMTEAIISPVLTPDKLISEHMMFIAVLHANVGVEIGAQFLLTLVKKFEEMSKIPQDVENKQLDNLIVMIAHLYNFKIYKHRLLYEILERLTDNFTEKDIELILVILRTVGFPLRKDDPIALKNLILKLQQKAISTKSDNTRVKFMLDVLLAIKNNNMSKIPQYDPSHVEHLKKLMKTLLHKGNTVTPFNITLDDLLHVDERGKWWIVGSAWTGMTDINKSKNSDEVNEQIFSQKILDLAHKQRMNTDARRNIFCILMTAEDYLDAFEKLHHLGLKDQQEREVIYVLIDCLLHEKNFNPYYALLAQQFCDYDRKYQMTIQYTLWDKLKLLNDYDTKQLTNLSRFLTHLFINKGLPFSVLKVIHFAELDKPTLRVLRQIMLGILLHEDEDASIQVFERISGSPKLQSFRESLRLFIHHFLLKNIDNNSRLEQERTLLKKRIELVDKMLISRGNKMVF